MAFILNDESVVVVRSFSWDQLREHGRRERGLVEKSGLAGRLLRLLRRLFGRYQDWNDRQLGMVEWAIEAVYPDEFERVRCSSSDMIKLYHLTVAASTGIDGDLGNLLRSGGRTAAQTQENIDDTVPTMDKSA